MFLQMFMVIVTLPLYDDSYFRLGSKNTAVWYSPNVNEIGMQCMLSICSFLLTIRFCFSTFTPGFLASIKDRTRDKTIASITLPSSERRNSSDATLHTYLFIVMQRDSGSKTPDSFIILQSRVLIQMDSFLDYYPLIEVSTLNMMQPSEGLSGRGATMSSVVLARIAVFPSLSQTPPRAGRNLATSLLESKSWRPSGRSFFSKQSWRYVFSRLEYIIKQYMLVFELQYQMQRGRERRLSSNSHLKLFPASNRKAGQPATLWVLLYLLHRLGANLSYFIVSPLMYRYPLFNIGHRQQLLLQFFRVDQLLQSSSSAQIQSIASQIGLGDNSTLELIDLLFPHQQTHQQASKDPFRPGDALSSNSTLVDEDVPQSHLYNIFRDKTKVYRAILNCTNISTMNSKFYIVQVLVKAGTEQYFTWTRWGRVGTIGQHSLQGPMSQSDAILRFENKVKDKVKAGYQQVMILSDAASPVLNEEKAEVQEQKTESEATGPGLDEGIEDLVGCLFNDSNISKWTSVLGYNQKAAPIQKLSKKVLDQAYSILVNLHKAVVEEDQANITSLTSLFYSCIPFSFGFMKMSQFILDTRQKVKEKFSVLRTLENLQILKEKMHSKISPKSCMQKYYDGLNCHISRLPADSSARGIIIQYFENSKAPSFLQIQDIYEVNREKDSEYDTSIDNKMLLWYPTKDVDLVGVLVEGVRIYGSSEAEIGNLGNGIYMYDTLDGAINGKMAKHNDMADRCYLVVEAALGETLVLEKASSSARQQMLKQHKNPVKCNGAIRIPQSGCKLFGSITVPLEKPEESIECSSGLMYNEYVVYNSNQVRIRYLVKTKKHQ